MEQNNYSKSIFLILFAFLVVLIAAILKTTASVTMPVTLAILLAFVFYPFLKKMNQVHIPWILGIVIILLAAIALVYVLGNLLASSATAIISCYPKYESRFESIYIFFVKTFNLPYDESSNMWINLWNSLNLKDHIQNFALTLSTNLISFVKVLLMIFLFLLFLLIEMKTIHKKVDLAFPDNDNARTKIVNISKNIVSQVTHYISIKFLVSLLTGLLVALSTAVVNMDFPIVWGFIAFVLNFIPTFGSIISWLVTTIFALIQFFPNWGIIIYVSVIVILINMVIGNFIEPKWEGTDLGISPFMILVSLSLWGWIWNFVGMIVAVPLTVTIKIIFENIPILEPVAVLMGNGKTALKNKKDEENSSQKKKFFKRIREFCLKEKKSNGSEISKSTKTSQNQKE